MIPGGVDIILSPAAVKAWRESGSNSPITTPHDSPFVGRFIGLKLSFPQLDQYKRKVRVQLTLSIASVYHPVDETEHTEFIDTPIYIMSLVPKTVEFIGGHDINANLGTCTKMHQKTLGPWGIYNRNMKGRRILGFFSHNRLKVTNSFFKKPSFVILRSFSKVRSPHMLDVISVSETFFKYVRNFGVSPKGMRSDHSGVYLDLLNRSIEYKSTFIKRPVIYWKAIKERGEVNENLNLMNRLCEPFNYTE